MGMEQSSGETPREASFYHTVKVEVSEAQFELMDTLSYVDVERIAQAERVSIPFGTVVTECCRRLVHVIVERGMVTAINVEHDEDSAANRAEVDPETLEFMRAATASLDRQRPTGELPIPFNDLVANPRIGFEWWTCFRICIFGYCLFCCYGDTAGPWAHCEIERIGSRF
jgi:hypothetical protein